MKERVLTLDLKGAIEAFSATRWKFYQEDDEASLIKVEVPRGIDEAYVIELPYKSDQEKEMIGDCLLGNGFIEQKKRVTASW